MQHRNQGRVRVDFVRERLVRPEQLPPLEARYLALVDQRDEEFCEIERRSEKRVLFANAVDIETGFFFCSHAARGQRLYANGGTQFNVICVGEINSKQ